MGSVEDAYGVIRSCARSTDGDVEGWREALAAALPAGPLTDAFLSAALEPLDALEASRALRELALLGRREVAKAALARVGGADPTAELNLGSALTACGDERGAQALWRLYLAHRGRTEGPDWVPTAWIFDALHEMRDNPIARRLTVEITTAENARGKT